MGNIIAPSGASLSDAIADGDAVAAVEVLQAHPDLTRKRLGAKKRTLYHYCAASGQVAVLKSLCEHVWRSAPDEGAGAGRGEGGRGRPHPAILQYINASDQKGLTPLSLACKKGHAQVVAFLLTQGADPWVKDRLAGRTALHHAARANHPECINAILSSPLVQQQQEQELASGPGGSPAKLVDLPNNSGYTPLHYAAAAHSAEAAAALLRHGADPNAKTWQVGFGHIQLDRGSTPLHAAARYQSLDVAVLLLRHWDETLRRRDVTDPRVVENLQRIKPYQLPGIKLNKALFRVLDPGTPIKEIRELYGFVDGGGGGGKGGGAGGSGGGGGGGGGAAEAAGARKRKSKGFMSRQDDSDSCRMSCDGGISGSPEELTLTTEVAASAAATAAAAAAAVSSDRASPNMRLRRHASSGATPCQSQSQAVSAPEPSSSEPSVRTSRGSGGPRGRAPAPPTADRSQRRSCFLEESSAAPAAPASPFSPKTAALAGAGVSAGVSVSVSAGASAGAGASAFNACEDDRTEPHHAPSRQRSGRHRIAPSLPVPSFLNAPAAAAATAAAAAAAAAAAPSPSSGGLMGRTRSGAIMPLPPAFGGHSSSGPGPQLHRTRSLQNPAGAPVVVAVAAATPSSEGHVISTGELRDRSVHRGGGGGGGGVGIAAAGTDWPSTGFESSSSPPPEAGGGAAASLGGRVAPTSSWVVSEEPFPPRTPLTSRPSPHPQQQRLSARSQSAREGGFVLFGGTAAVAPPPPPPQPLVRGCDSAAAAAPPPPPSGTTNSAWHDVALKRQPPAPIQVQPRGAEDPTGKPQTQPQPPSSPSPSSPSSPALSMSASSLAKGGRSLARKLSQKMSLLAAAATRSSAVRHDEVRACSPRQGPACSGGGGGDTPRAPEAATPGWARTLSGGAGGGDAGGGGVMVSPPAVRSAF
ncbi:hypothetical protein PLESTM_000261000 [Pleodorina starrii]|nr:hypothetical protein PLESTM_000261000 [Pleodorina starrii]